MKPSLRYENGIAYIDFHNDLTPEEIIDFFENEVLVLYKKVGTPLVELISLEDMKDPANVETRRALIEEIKKLTYIYQCAAVYGFGNTLIQAAVNVLFLLVGHKNRLRLFDSKAEAIQWLEEVTGRQLPQ